MIRIVLSLCALALLVPISPESRAGDFDFEGPEVASEGYLDLFFTIPYVLGKGRTEDEVYQKITSKRVRFLKCYESIRTPVPEIKVKVRFKVGAQGAVSELKVVESTAHKNLVFPSCVLNVFKLMKFDAVDGEKGEAIVEQAVIFRIIDG